MRSPIRPASGSRSGSSRSTRPTPALAEAGGRAFGVLVREVRAIRGTPEDSAGGPDFEAGVALAWSAVHGFAQLLIDGRLSVVAPALDRDALLGDRRGGPLLPGKRRSRALLGVRPHGRPSSSRAPWLRPAWPSTRPAARARTCAKPESDALEVGSLTGFGSLFSGRVKRCTPKFSEASSPIAAIRRIGRKRSNTAFRRSDSSSSISIRSKRPSRAPRRRWTKRSSRIDIGGVSLIRAAAKNFAHVTVLVDPDQYAIVHGSARRRRCRDAPPFCDARVRAYGGIRFFDRALSRGRTARARAAGLARVDDSARDAAALRRESAIARGVLSTRARSGLCPSSSGGKANSPTTICSISTRRSACSCARRKAKPSRHHARHRFAPPSLNTLFPCGVAEACQRLSMPIRAEPWIAILFRLSEASSPPMPTIDLAAAEASRRSFFWKSSPHRLSTTTALERLCKKKKNLRIIALRSERLPESLRARIARAHRPAAESSPKTMIRMQAPAETWRVVFRSAIPSDGDSGRDLTIRLGHRTACQEQRHRDRARSHHARHLRGADQSRLGRAHRGRTRGRIRSGAACASDGFFPFADGLEAAHASGATAVIAPQGSIRGRRSHRSGRPPSAWP